MSQLQLLLTVSAFCTTISAGMMEHRPHKREHLPPELDQEGQNICSGFVLGAQCTSGYFQEYIDFAAKCNDIGIYRTIAASGYCDVNAMGEICTALIEEAIIAERNASRVCGTSPTTCSSDCRDLLVTIHDRQGCCVHKFNTTDIQLLYSYSLWKLCNVKPVAEQRECESIFDFSNTQVDPTCTRASYFQQLYFNVFCRRQYIESTEAVRGACRLGVFDTLEVYSSCEANEDGQYCFAITKEDSFSIRLPAVHACTNTSVCDPLCIEAINNGTDSIGCCFVTLFNRTFYDWMTYEFWEQCNLTSTGSCDPLFNEAASNISVVLPRPTQSGTLTLAALTSMVAIMCTLLSTVFKIH